MHKISFATMTVIALLVLPASAYAAINSFTVTYDVPGAVGSATLIVNATAANVKGEIAVNAGMNICQKARGIAKSICVNCGGVAVIGGVSSACSAIDETQVCATQVADIEVQCSANDFRVTNLAATDQLTVRPFPAGSNSKIASVIVKPSKCNELDFTSSASAPPVVVVTLIREFGAVDGNVELIFNNNAPIQSVSTSTAGKTSNQVLQDLQAQLASVSVNGAVRTRTPSFNPSVTLPGNSLLMTGLQSKPVFGFRAPAGWTIAAEGAADVPPATPHIPAVTGWGFALMVGFILLTAAWFLRRGMPRTA